MLQIVLDQFNDKIEFFCANLTALSLKPISNVACLCGKILPMLEFRQNEIPTLI